jgi:VanZ family protein
MSSSRRGAAFWIYTWWPVAVAVAIIVTESTEMMGADHTNGPLHRLFEDIFGPIGEHNWELIHLVVRKSGHFIGYGIVGLVWLRAWWRTFSSASFFRCFVLSVLGTFLVAGADEWHQSLLPNRGGRFTDVLLDCSGAIALMAVSYLLLRVFRYRTLLIRAAPQGR